MTAQLLEVVTYIMEGIALLDLDDTYAAAMPETWRQGQALLRSADACDQYHGYRLMLAALKETPNGAQILIDALDKGLAGHV